MKLNHFASTSALLVIAALAACAASFDEQAACAAPATDVWPPAWQHAPASPPGSFTLPYFEPPSASHCQRAPTMREVPGRSAHENGAAWRLRKDSGDKLRAAPAINALTIDSAATEAAAPAAARAESERRAVAATGRGGARGASAGAGTQTVHDVKNYSVQTLDRLVLRLVSEEMARPGRS